jgi:hypothetical protein
LASPIGARQGDTEQKLKQDDAVSASQLPEPAPQGARSPDSGITDTQSLDLARAVQETWRSPVDLGGNPIPQPRLSAPPKFESGQ